MDKYWVRYLRDSMGRPIGCAAVSSSGAYGLSLCSQLDIPNKKRARLIAEGRLKKGKYRIENLRMAMVQPSPRAADPILRTLAMNVFESAEYRLAAMALRLSQEMAQPRPELPA